MIIYDDSMQYQEYSYVKYTLTISLCSVVKHNKSPLLLLMIKTFILVFFPAGYLPTLYDFHFDGQQQKWVPWSSLVTNYIHNPEVKFADILGEA